MLGGVCVVSAQLDADGAIRQLAAFQSLTYGELDGSRSERIEKVDATLNGAGFEARLSEQIRLEMGRSGSSSPLLPGSPA